MIRITSFVLRFIDNIKLKVENKTNKIGFLSNNEIKKELANNLSVFLDKNGLSRVKRRSPDLLLPYETKFLILLNKNSLLVRAIIFDCHSFTFWIKGHPK